MGSRKLLWPTIIGLFNVHIVVPWYFLAMLNYFEKCWKFCNSFLERKTPKYLWGVVEIINYFTRIN